MKYQETNRYIYRTTNMVNGMKYAGRRICHCAIEDDDYLGSGTAFKKALKVYGRSNFKKEILKVCKTDAELYRQEEKITHELDVVRSREYYNQVYGGAPRPDGFEYTEEEIEKMNYLEGMMDNEVLYFARVNRENRTTPQVILLSLNVVGDKIIGAFTSLIDDMSENKNRAVFTSRGNHFTEKYMRKNGLQEWINNVGFVLIDKEKSNEYRRRAESGTISFNDVVAEIESKKNSKKIKEENTVSVDKCNFASKSDSAKNTDTNMNHIIRLARTSNDYHNFMELYNRFKDIGFTNVYHAVTGSGSITAADAEIIRSGKLKCSADSVRRATDILTYESKFKDIANAIGGRRDYFNIALAFCFNHPEIDNNILLKRLRKNYGEMTKIKSITDALRKIEKIYNNRRKPKVALEHDYLRSRNE